MNKSNKIKENTKTEDLPTTMDELFVADQSRQQKKLMSYVPSFFTTASLPFRNVNSPVFIRKGSNGITLKLSAFTFYNSCSTLQAKGLCSFH